MMLLAASVLAGPGAAIADGRSSAPPAPLLITDAGLYSVTIELYPGWNLIGVPREINISGDSYPRLRTLAGYKAWYYWPADGNYYGTNTLLPGWGYWLEADERATFTFGRELILLPTPTPPPMTTPARFVP